jgi:hypothetical protein
MTVFDWQVAILKRLDQGLPNTRVFLEGVPESTHVPKDPTGLVKPFVILWFGQLNEETGIEQPGDLCGPDGTDSRIMRGRFIVETVAPTGMALLRLEDECRRILRGWTPPGHGMLEEGGVATIRDPYPDGLGVDARFYKAMYFSGRVVQDDLEPEAVPNAFKTHCPQGHPYDQVNTILGGDGKRRCRTCVNARARARRVGA